MNAFIEWKREHYKSIHKTGLSKKYNPFIIFTDRGSDQTVTSEEIKEVAEKLQKRLIEISEKEENKDVKKKF